MKVKGSTSHWPAVRGRALIVLSFCIALLSCVFASPAGAITRSDVIKRANVWVQRRVGYSQRSYYKGYRRDCSGFVSMAWKLGTSYTTRTISKKANRVSLLALKPGDAILMPHHVAVFGGWKNKKRRQFVALEETTWGSHAKRHVRKIPHRAVGLRRKGIRDRRRVYVKPRPKPRVITAPVSKPATPTISPLPSPSGEATATLDATLTPSATVRPAALSGPLTSVPLPSMFASVEVVPGLAPTRWALS